MTLFDAHLDLAMNAIEWNRDLRQPASAIRSKEAHLKDKPDRGRGTVSLPELRRGSVKIVVGTQIARIEHDHYSPVAGWRSAEQAWAMTQAQRAWYETMVEQGEMFSIRNRATLEQHLASSASDDPRQPVGLILSLEGADSLISLNHLARAWGYGLRAVGPAHYGPGVYANGTNASGGLTARGRELVPEMERLGYILDVTHLCDESFWEALDLFNGPVWASHQNCRAIVPHMRQFGDDQFRELFRRDAVIGVAFDAWMLVPDWQRGVSTPANRGVTLEHVCNQIDYICQLAGSARHVGLGTDLDGAFGTEQCPGDIDTIADLVRIPDILKRRGYSDADVEGIMGQNFIGFLRRIWR
ncbi:MAG TPA: membrane dipeptidase [Candidatus Limnocylindria bacterium]|jgi:membrane dipeptidase|nr:membrane dipeptidase [Candidatus Limnocylindria bacterium]